MVVQSILHACMLSCIYYTTCVRVYLYNYYHLCSIYLAKWVSHRITLDTRHLNSNKKNISGMTYWLMVSSESGT